MTNSSRSLFALVTVVLYAACAPSQLRSRAVTPLPDMGVVGPPGERALTMSNDTHWARNSAEHRAIYLEVYRAASDRLATLISGRTTATWGVILDADETVLDNSDYQKSRVPFGGSYDAATWTVWVDQARAPALPGAVGFVSLVHQLGGKVVIVTNRDNAQCPVTRANLTSDGIITDLVLCKTTTTDKNPRFEAVQHGTAAAGFPPIAVLEWIGDNILDFPSLTQDIRTGAEGGYSKFGDTYFALPNAMYGSWERTQRQ